MFSIETAGVVGVHGDTEWVIDRDKSAWLQRVTGHLSDSLDAFQFHLGDRVFLLERTRWQNPEKAYSSRIVNFGFSSLATHATGIRSESFLSDDDRERVGLVAMEALLVYGGFYSGSNDPATNRDTISLPGRTMHERWPSGKGLEWLANYSTYFKQSYDSDERVLRLVDFAGK